MPQLVRTAIAAALLSGTALAQGPSDRLAIIETANALDAAIDAKDWKEAGTLFTETIDFRYGEVDPEEMLSADLVTMWSQNLYAEKASFHLRGGHLVTFTGEDEAEIRSKAYAINKLADFDGGDLWEVWGDYIYRMQRTEEGWRIASFAFEPVHERGNDRIPSHRP
jgi:hypothetical protein